MLNKKQFNEPLELIDDVIVILTSENHPLKHIVPRLIEDLNHLKKIFLKTQTDYKRLHDTDFFSLGVPAACWHEYTSDPLFNQNVDRHLSKVAYLIRQKQNGLVVDWKYLNSI